jgi:N-dimethylarginine dimethylaminohydrolase
VRFDRFGGHSSIAPLRDVLVKRPGPAFGRAFDDPAHGFLHAVDLELAQRQHDAFCELITALGATVHELGEETDSPDLVYTYDPAVVTDDGVVTLRCGKANRLGEQAVLERWLLDRGIPPAGRIEAPGTVDGGDTVWLRDRFVIGRSLRTNRAGASQLASIMGGDVFMVDVPYANGPGECLHLMSLISPVAEDLAVAFLPMLPAGLYDLTQELGIELIRVPEDEMPTLGCNILAVRPGVVVMPEGNPQTHLALLDRGCEVHAFEADEVGINGSGGPTCMTRAILRSAS